MAIITLENCKLTNIIIGSQVNFYRPGSLVPFARRPAGTTIQLESQYDLAFIRVSGAADEGLNGGVLVPGNLTVGPEQELSIEAIDGVVRFIRRD